MTAAYHQTGFHHGKQDRYSNYDLQSAVRALDRDPRAKSLIRNTEQAATQFSIVPTNAPDMPFIQPAFQKRCEGFLLDGWRMPVRELPGCQKNRLQSTWHDKTPTTAAS